MSKGKAMIHHIYGVKVIDGAKERRYYGHVETRDEAIDAINSIIDDLDYAYAKEGTATVLYLDHSEGPYRERLLHQGQTKRQADQENFSWPDRMQPRIDELERNYPAIPHHL